MDMTQESNHLELCGTLAGAPVFSHSSRGAEFWRFPLSVRRLSGTADLLNVVARRRLLDTLAPQSAGKLQLTGELRSFNNRSGSGAKLVISAFARELRFCEDGDANRLFLRGTLCKPPNLRQTPLGRDICDLMLAVNRPYGRSDYLPCICWGSLARQAARWQVGDRLRLEGRVQSRRYLKNTDSGPVERTAYEVSVLTAMREDTQL
jgi:primosomal replication protein N